MKARGQPESERVWDQQPKEGAKAFGASRVYLELGPGRSIPQTARELGRAESLVWRWASKYRWRERAAAWDAAMAHQREQDLRAPRLELLERRQRRAKEAEAAGRLLLHHGLARDPHSGEVQRVVPEALRYGERYLRLATELEDLCLAGAEPEVPDSTIEDDVLASDDAALRQLIKQVQGEPPAPEGKE
jgi:hypothetical protein